MCISTDFDQGFQFILEALCRSYSCRISFLCYLVCTSVFVDLCQFRLSHDNKNQGQNAEALGTESGIKTDELKKNNGRTLIRLAGEWDAGVETC